MKAHFINKNYIVVYWVVSYTLEKKQMEIDQESDELSNFLRNLASVHVDKPRNTAVIVSHLTLFARIFTIYSFHRVFWHYTTLLKPFLRFQQCVQNSCPRFQSVLVRLSQSLRGQSSLSSVLNVLLFSVTVSWTRLQASGWYISHRRRCYSSFSYYSLSGIDVQRPTFCSRLLPAHFHELDVWLLSGGTEKLFAACCKL